MRSSQRTGCDYGGDGGDDDDDLHRQDAYEAGGERGGVCAGDATRWYANGTNRRCYSYAHARGWWCE